MLQLVRVSALSGVDVDYTVLRHFYSVLGIFILVFGLHSSKKYLTQVPPQIVLQQIQP